MASQINEKAEPRYYTENVRRMLDEVNQQMHAAINDVQDPRAKALLETSHEVVSGLVKAFSDYDRGEEPAWK